MINYKKKFDLSNKVAFVVGGNGLIGREVVCALSNFGAKVIILDLKAKNYFSKEDKSIHFEYFDCSKMNSIEKNIEKFILKYSVPDILVNCSYPYNKQWHKSSFNEIKLKTILDNVNMHMNSYIWIARLVAEKMKKKKISGSIIQLGSTYGVVGQNLSIYKGTKMQENLSYAAIKGGIVNNARLMASYYGKYKIRINCVCPGGLSGHVAGLSNKQPKKFMKKYLENVPMNRMGKPEEVASAIVFLSSEAASYITGSTFMIDGGWTAI
jgi:NAD(P)-dependent dehydrogenase (short-subunit alcohol dehydrogenase family)